MKKQKTDYKVVDAIGQKLDKTQRYAHAYT